LFNKNFGNIEKDNDIAHIIYENKFARCN